jgi:Flp pilus assembly protein TadD
MSEPTTALPEDFSDLTTLVPQLKAVKKPAGLSESSLETLYATGFDHLKEGQFEKALKVFQLLFSYLPGDARFSAGVAHSLMGQKQHELASGWFSLACALDENNAGYQLSLSKAYIGCGHRQLARLSLRVARLNADDSPAGQRIRQQASALLTLIEKNDALPA